MLPPGTRMSDVDATVQDSPEERGCEVCGHDAGECTCCGCCHQDRADCKCWSAEENTEAA